jgi:hypothetical protein
MTQPSWRGLPQSSWLGLTRPSASTRHGMPRVIDGLVKPGHDGGCGGERDGGYDRGGGGDGRVEVRR